METEKPAIVFTDKVAERIKGLISEEGNPNLKLRIFIKGGGCSGLEYMFVFEERAADDDTLFEKNGVTFLVDPISYQYLAGATVDYQESLGGAEFVITNPNATKSCGCGSSFQV